MLCDHCSNMSRVRLSSASSSCRLIAAMPDAGGCVRASVSVCSL
jgi:hypothetical protein